MTKDFCRFHRKVDGCVIFFKVVVEANEMEDQNLWGFRNCRYLDECTRFLAMITLEVTLVPDCDMMTIDTVSECWDCRREGYAADRCVAGSDDLRSADNNSQVRGR